MANNNVKCFKYGKGRVKAGCTICAVCNRKNSAALSQRAHTTETVILVNEALMFAQCHRDDGSKDTIT